MPTHIHNIVKKWTRLDQGFMTEHILDRIIICKAWHYDRGLNTNHLPIIIKIDATLESIETVKTNNFRDINWDDFYEILEEQLTRFTVPRWPANQEVVSHECDRLTKAIQETISKAVPYSIMCPHSKCWWTKKLQETRKKFQKLGRESSKYKNSPEHAAYKEYMVICTHNG